MHPRGKIVFLGLLVAATTSLLAAGACAMPVAALAPGAPAFPIPAAPAASVSGQWLAELTDDPGVVHFTIQQSEGRNHRMNADFDVASSNFRGLDLSRKASEGTVRFQLVRDAGTFDCEGWWKNGKGSGQFTFTPDAGFVSDMGRRGYALDDHDVFAFAAFDVSRAFLDEMAEVGYEKISKDQLVALRIFKVDGALVRDLRALGYERVALDNLVAMRVHGATIDFIHELQGLGYDRVSVDQLVAMRVHGASAEFIKELNALGYERVPIDQLIAMRVHGASPAFIRELKSLGFDRVSVDQLVAMRVHGVDREFIERARSQGYPDATVDKLVELRVMGTLERGDR